MSFAAISAPATMSAQASAADYMERMLGSIVAFRIEVRRTLAKSKLSQNREERDYRGAIAGLRATGHERLADRMASLRAEAK